jgi:predicted esterase
MTHRAIVQDPHGGGRLVAAGVPLNEAAGVLIAIHGRGADAEDIIGLAREIALGNLAILAPEATGNTWYPYRFTEPFERNEPYLSSALGVIQSTISDLVARGISTDRIALMGFSQGACLALESAARNPRRYAAAIGFSGGLIGPPGTRFDFPGSLDGTPVFIGCSDVDPHIPIERVTESAVALERMGAAVEARIYPGMGHTVNRDELEAATAILQSAFSTSPA